MCMDGLFSLLFFPHLGTEFEFLALGPLSLSKLSIMMLMEMMMKKMMMMKKKITTKMMMMKR